MWSIFAYPLYILTTYIIIMAGLLTAHQTVPNAPSIVGFIAHTMGAYLGLLICAAYGTVASAILTLFNLHFAYGQWTTAKAFKYVGGALTGVRFKILDNGEEILNRSRPVVIIGNHQTELDILMLGSIWPTHTSVTAKKSLRNVPFLGWFMSLSGAVFIDRVDKTQALKAFESASKAMNSKKQSVFIFPEGTRSYSTEPTLLPFKKGAFHLAVQAQVDILPVVCENYSKVLNVKTKLFKRGSVRVKVLDPISTKGLTTADVDRLTTETREKMLKVIIQMSQDSNTRSAAPIQVKKMS